MCSDPFDSATIGELGTDNSGICSDYDLFHDPPFLHGDVHGDAHHVHGNNQGDAHHVHGDNEEDAHHLHGDIPGDDIHRRQRRGGNEYHQISITSNGMELITDIVYGDEQVSLRCNSDGTMVVIYDDDDDGSDDSDAQFDVTNVVITCRETTF